LQIRLRAYQRSASLLGAPPLKYYTRLKYLVRTNTLDYFYMTAILKNKKSYCIGDWCVWLVPIYIHPSPIFVVMAWERQTHWSKFGEKTFFENWKNSSFVNEKRQQTLVIVCFVLMVRTSLKINKILLRFEEIRNHEFEELLKIPWKLKNFEIRK